MKHYTLVFNTSVGSRRSLRINNPNIDMPLAAIQAATGVMIQNDVFDQERGALESVNRMELTQVTHDVLFSA